MRLFYIANIRLPTEKAHGIQIMEMCSAFAKAMAGMPAFDSVELIVPTRTNSNFQGVDPFEYYGVEHNFTIHYVRTPDPTWLMKIPGGVYYKIQSYVFVRGLVQMLASMMRPEDVVYTRDELLLPDLLRLSRNIVWEAHTLPSKRSRYVKYWNQCKKVIGITRGLKDELIRLGVPEDKTIIAPDAVDLNKFQRNEITPEERIQLGIPNNKKIIFYSGHLFGWKGAQVLAEASEYLPINDVVVFLGGMKSDVEKFISQNRNRTNVVILPHVPFIELPRYMSCADVAVLPNRGSHEISALFTSPLKLFQYMAMGLPIVASDLPSIREVLNESNAVLVKPGNSEQLASGIQSLLSDPDLAKRISTKAFEDVQQFTWDKRAERILSVLN